ncbi:MAG: Grx4 family monothiol glutaredoxin [Bacteriovoracaceae bacterium]
MPIDSVDKSIDLTKQIESLIGSADLFLFMKGTPNAPMCGFSANVINILNHMGKTYKTFDILTDMEIRQGVKEYASWPTFPQLYVKGELIGGNDIITEMYHSGDLEKTLA